MIGVTPENQENQIAQSQITDRQITDRATNTSWADMNAAPETEKEIENLNDNDQKLKFGARVRAIRLARGLTTDELGAKLYPNIAGSPGGVVSNMENGKVMPKIPLLMRLCEVLKVSETELLNPNEGREDYLTFSLTELEDSTRVKKHQLRIDIKAGLLPRINSKSRSVRVSGFALKNYLKAKLESEKNQDAQRQ